MTILEDNIYGLTIDESITILYRDYYSSPPPTGAALDFEREEFHKSYNFMNERFENRTTGWVYARTRRRPPNQWVYYAAAKIAAGLGGPVVRVLDEAISVEAFERYYNEWETRTKTMTRMQNLDIEARRYGALMRGDAAGAAAIERELDQLRIISPRLGLFNFGAGIADQSLAVLEADPRAWLIQKDIKQVRQDIKRVQRSTARFSSTVEALMRARRLI